jgi:hypothetical protein
MSFSEGFSARCAHSAQSGKEVIMETQETQKTQAEAPASSEKTSEKKGNENKEEAQTSAGYAIERKDGFVKFILTLPSEDKLRKISFEDVQTLQRQAAKAIKDIAKAVNLTIFLKGIPRGD